MPKFLPTGFLLFGAFIARAQQVDTLASVTPDSLAGPLPARIISSSGIASAATAPLPYYTTVQPLLSRVAGVQVTPYSGAPGAGAVVRLRGAASLDSNVQPLYVVDDVPVFQYRFGSQDPYHTPSFQSSFTNPDASTNPLLSIAPEDIEQVEVLKGAFETAQYGFLGQNGVIRIRTRRGVGGQAVRVQYTGLGGVQTARRRYDLLGAREAAELANEADRNNGYSPEYTPNQIAGFGAGTDWQAEVLRTAALQEHHLSLSGGTAFGTRYYAALDYLGQQGIVLNTNLHRYGLRLNLDQNVGLHLRLSGGLSYGQAEERRPDGNLFRQTLRYLPTVPVYASNGNYAADYSAPNPVQLAQQNRSTARNRRLLAHAELRYEVVTGLTLDLRAALERDSLNGYDYQGPMNDFAPRDGFQTGIRSAFYQQLTLNPALRFARTLAGRHTLTASVEATSWKHRKSQSFEEYSVPLPPYNLPPRGGSSSRATNTYDQLGYQATAGYAYGGRYALQGSLRADLSSRMPEAERQQWLPAVQATWHAAQEAWLKDRTRIGTLDLWAGWGQTSNRGNLAGDHGFGFQAGNTSFFQFLDEMTTQADAGLRLALWHDRLALTAAAYQRDTRANNIYVGHFDTPEPAHLTNRGVELTLTGNWQRGRLQGSSSLAVSFNRNRYDKPAGSMVLDYRPAPYYFVMRSGQPLASFIGYRYLGVDAAGRPQFEGGASGGPTQQILGNGLPQQLLNFTQELHYDRYGLSAQVDGLFGYQVFDPNLSLLDLPYGGFNATTRVRDRWTPTNPTTDVPRAGTATATAGFSGPNTYTLQSGNHVRLSSMVLTAEVWRRGPHSASVFLSGTNLLVISAYRGFDPNVSAAEADPKQAGLDQAAYPTPRTVALGVRASF
ncbi:SusC/RagA family TonB-linked outer membrane protein [Hymenobacter sp. BT770]|uniref:SusC/RagA family TonB-linked outer membrane protein n=1 Tax=Hymenobacter sp. BT770 TaxID=2886942 RepID=UPI001D110778|nr:SusC/RagA family TonB-linked outer membrane protein [Hymenobacter sp. BT770]MCC3151872.1 SusC/RagA family TonB-linked outer membrane protein [Hymenobacter sp. BT770]MDO3413506.1 SusC/RagA family TonB-linked outer membrane protein [Hymenobacter sp. BT770]